MFQFCFCFFQQDRGDNARSASTTLMVMVKDSDDLPPKFTESIYRTKINEFSPITVSVPNVFDNLSFSTKFLFNTKAEKNEGVVNSYNGALTKEYRLFYMEIVFVWSIDIVVLAPFTFQTKTNSN